MLGQVEGARITVDALGILLRRLGYREAVDAAFMRWGELNLPAEMRPYGITVSGDEATINPPGALNVLLDAARIRQSPWNTLFWATMATGAGAVVYFTIGRVMMERRRR